MSTEENKRIARRFIEESFGQGKFHLLDEILADDYLDHDAPPGTPPGREGMKYIKAAYRSAFPDLQFTIEDQIAEGDKVTTRWTFRGTHTGELFGIPPTGKKVVMPGISIYRIADARMQEAWVRYDLLGMMQQLGVVSMPGQ